MRIINRDNKVAVVDYGLGNLFSLERALRHVGADPEITADEETLMGAAGIILPGVGAFKDGMQRLEQRALVNPMLKFAESGKPVLGVCLGMQLLFDASEEFGHYQGLGLVAGKVIRLLASDQDGRRVKIPHIGWNELHPAQENLSWESTNLCGLKPGDAAYFVHSYVPKPLADRCAVAKMNYGGHWYCAAIEQGNISGVQFHPEKSGEVGLRILGNFVNRCKATVPC